MDLRYVAVAIIVLSAAAVIGLAALDSTSSERSGEDMDYTVFSTSGELEVSVGKEFTVALRGNVTTGYDWTVSSDGGLRLVKDWYQADDAGNPPRVGVGGMHYFTFVADDAGTYEVTLDYLRSWEGSEGNVVTIAVSTV